MVPLIPFVRSIPIINATTLIISTDTIVNNAVSFYEGLLSYEGGDYTTVFAVIDHGNDVDLTLPLYYATHPQDAVLLKMKLWKYL